MKDIIIQFYFVKEVGQKLHLELQKKVEKEKEQSLGNFPFRLFPKHSPFVNFEILTLIYLGQPVYIYEAFQDNVKEEVQNAGLNRLEWLERNALIPLEYEVKEEEKGLQQYEKTKQLEKARRFFEKIREALEVGNFKLMFISDFTPDGFFRIAKIMDDYKEGKKNNKPKNNKFGEDLASIITEALRARSLIEEGRFSGNSTQMKALYNVLESKKYLKGTYKEERFSKFILEYFGFPITGRTFQNPQNNGQAIEENEFSKLIP